MKNIFNFLLVSIILVGCSAKHPIHQDFGPFCKAYPVLFWGPNGEAYYEIKDGLSENKINWYFKKLSEYGVEIKVSKDGQHKIRCIAKWREKDFLANVTKKSGILEGTEFE